VTSAYRCSRCERDTPDDRWLWRCEACKGPLELTGLPEFSPEMIEGADSSLWRYRAMLPAMSGGVVSMGEGWTPLIEAPLFGRRVSCKLEYLNPTASYKDRGVAVMVSAVRSRGATEVMDDSSGNAGASLAAYAARAGLRARIFVPAHAAPAKKRQITVYGAKLEVVPGSRAATAEAAEQAAEETHYASHAHTAHNLAGLETIAWEVWEQLERRAPAAMVFPVGQGTLLLGAYLGFCRLAEAGLIQTLPRMIGVQAEACAPLHEAWRAGLDDIPPVEEGETAAEGIRIRAPLRRKLLLAALRETDGQSVTVSEPEIAEAQDLLARQGLYVEPTSAVAAAGLRKLSGELPEGKTVLALTGSGLKTPISS
jgi:threonine synthase